MSVTAALTGAAIIARPSGSLQVALRIARGVCTGTGAVTLAYLGLGFVPFVRARSPLPAERRRALLEEIRSLVGHEPLADPWAAIKSGRLPALSFPELQRPWLFALFVAAARTTFAMYSDAAGKMTLSEFCCALHKLVDATLTVYSWREGSDQMATVFAAGEAQAGATRELVNKVADGAFRVIDEDQNGVIDAAEFAGAFVLVLATMHGVPPDAPLMQRLAFRVVNANGDGVVSERELEHWVRLALEQQTTPPGAQLEPIGPWGLFGTRVLSPAKLTRKWLRAADSDRDGALSPAEFASIAPLLRVHEVIRRLAHNFADRRLVTNLLEGGSE